MFPGATNVEWSRLQWNTSGASSFTDQILILADGTILAAL